IRDLIVTGVQTCALPICTIGELAHVWPANPIWLRWGGYLLLVIPLLIWFGVRKREVGASTGRTAPIFVLALLVTTYLLTIWQARSEERRVGKECRSWLSA